MQRQRETYPVNHSECSGMNVWLAGVDSYEMTGVELMLAEQFVRRVKVSTGTRFIPGDTLVLCLSSTIRIGWWRYLRLIQWLNNRYEINLIVLCPLQIFLMGIFCGENVVWLNGNAALASLSASLKFALKEKNRDTIRKNGNGINEFWRYAFMCLQEKPSDEIKMNLSKKAYHRRLSLLRRMNFNSMHALRIFMSGVKIKYYNHCPGCAL